MAIIDKRDRNNWYSSIRIENERPKNKYAQYLDHPETFDVNKLDVNEFATGSGQILAKIPKIPGRITRFRKNRNSSEYYIQLIIGTAYDREKKQDRNVKVTIGCDVSWHLPGMMMINDKYHEYFDHDGRLINDPMARIEKKPKRKTKGGKSDHPGGAEPENSKRNAEERDSRSGRKAPDNSEPETRPAPEPEEPTEEQMLEELKQKQAILDKKIAEQDRINAELQKACEDYRKAQEELDGIRMIRIAQWQEDEINRIEFLADILDGQKDIVYRQAGKNPYVPMSGVQISMINEVLAELKRIFAGVEGEEYLKLAEEPRQDPDDEKKEIPGATYGEMAFILQAYFSIVFACRMKRLRYREE